MSSFTSRLILSPIDSKFWCLVEPFRYRIGNYEIPKDIISIPAGFITDFASVPRIFHGIYPPWGDYGKAAILHDYLYANPIYSRLISDLVFNEAMEVLEVDKYTRNILYYGVRLGGHFPYKSGKERSKNNQKKYKDTIHCFTKNNYTPFNF